MARGALVCPLCETPVPKRVDMPSWGPVDLFTCEACGLTTLREELLRVKNFNILQGAGLSAALSNVISYGQTLGSSSGLASGPSITLKTGASLAAGSMLVVIVTYDINNGGFDGIAWGSTNLSFVSGVGFSASQELDLWVASIPADGTNSIVVDCNSAGSIQNWSAVMLEIRKPSGVALDAFAIDSSPGSTTPDSGPITTTGTDVVLTAVAFADSSFSGTWSGQVSQQQVAMAGGFALEQGIFSQAGIPQPPGIYRSLKTGANNVAWASLVVGFK